MRLIQEVLRYFIVAWWQHMASWILVNVGVSYIRDFTVGVIWWLVVCWLPRRNLDLSLFTIPPETNLNKIWIKILKFSHKKMTENVVGMSAKCQPFCSNPNVLTHWGRVTHKCVSKLTIIGSDNGLSPGRRQAIIWTNAGILLIRPLGTNFSEIYTLSFKKMHLEMSSGKWRPSCLGLNVLRGKTSLHTHWS